MDQHVSDLRDLAPGRSSAGFAGPARRRRIRPRQALLAAAALGGLGLGGWYGHDYWVRGRFMVSTDDAYLQADNVIVSPQVSGYVAAVLVDDNQQVKAGQALARVDDRTYLAALGSARASVAAEQAEIDTLGEQVGEQRATIGGLQASVESDQASMVFAEQQFARYSDLARTGAGTVQAEQQATLDIRQRQAGLAHDIAAVSAATRQVSVLQAELGQARATLGVRQAALQQAELNEGFTTITASVDGAVAARTVRVGQYVQAGTQLMAVVPLARVYVVANYKETQLTDVKPGQRVTIGVDMFPGAVVHGVVDSLAPATGQEFALLPPDNATGNFTKIVQRAPVKILIDRGDPLIGRLRPGMSVEPSIDVRTVGTVARDARTVGAVPRDARTGG